MDSDDRYSVLNRDNLTMQLPQKRKTFSEFLAVFFKSRFNFKYFEKKKMALVDFVFRELRTSKTQSDKSLKSLFSEDNPRASLSY